MTQNSTRGYVRTQQSAEADTEALRLRTAGLTYRQIATALGVDVATAHRRTQRALEAIPFDAVDEHRQLEAERLDSLTQAIWQSAMSGNLKAIDTALRVMERRARLLGLDLPVRQVVEQWTMESVGDAIKRLERELDAS